MNFVRIHDSREYIVDLMADLGTLIPSDIAGSHIDYEKSFFPTRPLAVDSSRIAISSSGVTISCEEQSEWHTPKNRSRSSYLNAAGNQSDEKSELVPSADLLLHNKAEEGSKKSSARSHRNVGKEAVGEIPRRPNHSHMHARSPSWTEGVCSPAARKMKVKDVSQYMINAAKENPQLAQKLHDVLLESGVVAPPDLFTEIYQEQVNITTVEHKSPAEDDERNRKRDDTLKTKGQGDLNRSLFLAPLLYHGAHSRGGHYGQAEDQSVSNEVVGERVSSQADVTPAKYVRNVPVAAVAAAAAVVASSMVVAAVRTTTDHSNLELPVASAATATAAAVVATTAAVGKQYENLDAHSLSAAPAFANPLGHERSDGDADSAEPQVSGDQAPDAAPGNHEGERISDRSTGNDSTKSDSALDEVSDRSPCSYNSYNMKLFDRSCCGTWNS